jgi:beta-galactosidase/beta-glucuronidase
MVKRIDELVEKGYANREYGTAYLKRFLTRTIDGGAAATAAPNKVVQVLPDKWRFAADDADKGVERSYHAADFDDSKWRTVATYSATLSGQGLSENTVLWYRTTFKAPDKHGPLTLLFPEVDGGVSVFVNGKAVDPMAVLPVPVKKKSNPDAPAVPRRAPFEVDLTPVLKTGDNVVAVRVDNRKISELFLGGILRPVVLVEKGPRP